MILIPVKKHWDHTSPSQVENYRTCPRKWYVEYILGERSPSTPAQQLGTDVHSVLEAYLKLGTPPPNTTAGIIAQTGLHLLPKPGTVIVEGKVEIPGAPVPMIGVIDLLDPEGSATGNPGILTIGDHKTSADRKYMKTKEQLAGDVQLNCYAHYGFSKRPDANIARMFHTYFGTRDSWSDQVSVMVSRTKVEQDWGGICETIKQMQADAAKEEGATRQVPTSCTMYGGCHLKDRCWGAGRAQAISVPIGVPEPTPASIVPVVLNPEPTPVVVQPIPTPRAASLTPVENVTMPDTDDIIAGLGLKSAAADAVIGAAATPAAPAAPAAPVAPAPTATAAAVAALVTPAAAPAVAPVAPVALSPGQAAHVDDVLAGLGLLPGRDGVNPPEPPGAQPPRETDTGLELGGPNGTVKKRRRTKAEIEAEKTMKAAAEVAAAVASGAVPPPPPSVVAQIPEALAAGGEDALAALTAMASAPTIAPVSVTPAVPVARANGARVRTLYVGCWPTKGATCVDFGDWVGPLQAAVAQQAKVSHVLAIDFGKGYAAVALQLSLMGWPDNVESFYIDPMGSSKQCLETLMQYADVVIHKM